uniref:Peptidase M14 domain-containing protein n=1 Tax=Glossina austeni TaxID=7395 RepID=A0A1A9VL72_GLOAU
MSSYLQEVDDFENVLIETVSKTRIRNVFPQKREPTYDVLDWFPDATSCEICVWMNSIIKSTTLEVQALLLISGTSTDWTHAIKGIPIALSIELPGGGILKRFKLPEQMNFRIIKNSARVVTDFDIGRSYEGRLIRGVKLSFKPGRKAIFIESNIHAGEWITSAACTYLIMELLYSRDPDVRELAESLDWWIIPVLNVVGFVYSHEKIYIALHSAAQAVLVPWTHTKVPPQTYSILMYVAKAFIEALYPRYHSRYRCGNSANVLKMFTGGSKDWAYAVKRVPIAFTIELAGKGSPKRFELPENMITRVGTELLDGFKGMIKAVKLLGYI